MKAPRGNFDSKRCNSGESTGVNINYGIRTNVGNDDDKDDDTTQ